MSFGKFSLLIVFAMVVGVIPMPVNAEDSLDNMITPTSHPTQFEDPRQTTDLRAIFLDNGLEDTFVTEGGTAQMYLLQGRYKLQDNLSLILTKIGLINISPSADPAVFDDETGFSNLDLGLKYSPVICPSDIVTLGLRYAIPLGDEDVLEGEGSGNITPSVAFGGQKDRINYIGYTGLRQRVDNEDSSFWDVHGHLSYMIDELYPFIELNYVHVYQDGTRLDTDTEGVDIWNLGAIYAGGSHVLSLAVGARYKATDNVELGLGYEFPIDQGRGDGGLDWRVGVDAVYRFDI